MASVSALDAALAELGAKPYHPIYAPLTSSEAVPPPPASAVAPQLTELEESPIDGYRSLTPEELRTQILAADLEWSAIYSNHDLWDPYWGDRYNTLEQIICDLIMELKYRFGGEVRDEDYENFQHSIHRPLSPALKTKQEALWALRATYCSVLESDPSVPHWNSECARLEQEVTEAQREFAALLATTEEKTAGVP